MPVAWSGHRGRAGFKPAPTGAGRMPGWRHWAHRRIVLWGGFELCHGNMVESGHAEWQGVVVRRWEWDMRDLPVERDPKSTVILAKSRTLTPAYEVPAFAGTTGFPQDLNVATAPARFGVPAFAGTAGLPQDLNVATAPARFEVPAFAGTTGLPQDLNVATAPARFEVPAFAGTTVKPQSITSIAIDY